MVSGEADQNGQIRVGLLVHHEHNVPRQGKPKGQVVRPQEKVPSVPQRSKLKVRKNKMHEPKKHGLYPVLTCFLDQYLMHKDAKPLPSTTSRRVKTSRRCGSQHANALRSRYPTRSIPVHGLEQRDFLLLDQGRFGPHILADRRVQERHGNNLLEAYAL